MFKMELIWLIERNALFLRLLSLKMSLRDMPCWERELAEQKTFFWSLARYSLSLGYSTFTQQDYVAGQQYNRQKINKIGGDAHLTLSEQNSMYVN
jgi:hypothetical protein